MATDEGVISAYNLEVDPQLTEGIGIQLRDIDVKRKPAGWFVFGWGIMSAEDNKSESPVQILRSSVETY